MPLQITSLIYSFSPNCQWKDSVSHCFFFLLQCFLLHEKGRGLKKCNVNNQHTHLFKAFSTPVDSITCLGYSLFVHKNPTAHVHSQQLSPTAMPFQVCISVLIVSTIISGLSSLVCIQCADWLILQHFTNVSYMCYSIWWTLQPNIKTHQSSN